MLIVLMLIGIAIFVGGCFSIKKSEDGEDCWMGLGIMSCVLSFIVCGICIFSMFSNGNGVVKGRYIDEYIQMYQEENENIEREVSAVVANYMNWEKDTYTQFKDESPIVLINLYPELNSNQLVDRQLTLYVENNAKIKELREQKIAVKAQKWWLYFGG